MEDVNDGSTWRLEKYQPVYGSLALSVIYHDMNQVAYEQINTNFDRYASNALSHIFLLDKYPGSLRSFQSVLLLQQNINNSKSCGLFFL